MMAPGSGCIAVAGQVGFQSRREQPDLDDQQYHDQNHGAVDRGEPAVLRRIGGSCALSFHADRHQPAVSRFERHARQRALRRALQHRAIGDRKEALMAGALEPVLLLRVIDGAGEVGTLLAVRYVGIGGGAHQDAGIVRRRDRRRA